MKKSIEFEFSYHEIVIIRDWRKIKEENMIHIYHLQ